MLGQEGVSTIFSFQVSEREFITSFYRAIPTIFSFFPRLRVISCFQHTVGSLSFSERCLFSGVSGTKLDENIFNHLHSRFSCTMNSLGLAKYLR